MIGVREQGVAGKTDKSHSISGEKRAYKPKQVGEEKERECLQTADASV